MDNICIQGNLIIFINVVEKMNYIIKKIIMKEEYGKGFDSRNL